MLFVAPTDPQWWVARRLIQLLTGVALVGILWSGPADATELAAPHTTTFTSIGEAGDSEPVTWAVDLVEPVAFTVEPGRLIATPVLTSIWEPRGSRSGTSLGSRAPPRH